MSEYQYYEFQAVDRPLADAEMRALRRVSTLIPERFVLPQRGNGEHPSIQ